jgi:hypothetical protein
MSSLLRYKKTGGFVQLVSLIETFGPQKKEKFLEMIEAEDKTWAQALREKMMTLERIFKWPDQVVIEVFKSLPHKNQAFALQGLKEDQRARMLAFFSAAERRRLDEIIFESTPKPDDIASNMIKVVEMARKMLLAGDLRAEKFDVGILIPEEYEAKLEGKSAHQVVEEAEGKLHEAAQGHVDSVGQLTTISLEATQLQRPLAILVKENKSLKEEVRVLREKLDHIKRIA